MFPFEHIINIDKTSKIPIYRQIAIAIITAIRNGSLKASTPLPGSRELARILQVHRKTIVAAYDELSAQDWILVIPRKQVLVSDRIPLLPPKKWSAAISESAYTNDFSLPFRQLTEDQKETFLNPIPDIIIDDGHPDVRLSPISDLLKTYRSYTGRKHAIKTAHIGTTQGTLKLREALVTYLSESRGLTITAENIMITHGAQMSIYLASQLLLNATTSIIVGQPNYQVADATFRQTGSKIITVPVDEYGIDTKAIELICKKSPIHAVYVIPHHHYPTTVTLSVARRMQLLELSRRYSFAIIEDDYDYDYHYTSSPYLPLASSAHNGHVIYIGSFSKILDPSLRMGFMIAPRNFIAQSTALRKLIDVGGDGYMQNALATLIKEGELKRHLKKAKKWYHQRRDFLDTLLKTHLSSYVTYTLPSGGMAIWIQLKKGYTVASLKAVNHLIIKEIDETNNAFRFGFASLNEQELEEAVMTLKTIFASLHT
ncbi:MocR-like pyridoxine biosynthesis transcription factor PdxR [Flavobacterium cerinum]|uniref:PLP-dependent aminotransferase family protein n=1 Tax=Flavobacterium cerinum TaxID=2502784 RepID=A0ABY5IR95_9FLAO|nr:PLP-dependent aminotransferase family protein [Flavobacterium cerinum]UUC44801.1 PLP-dependent aminotransferase family protein [Flavobacterium cerinum]